MGKCAEPTGAVSLRCLRGSQGFQSILTPLFSSQFPVVAFWGHPILEMRVVVSPSVTPCAPWVSHVSSSCQCPHVSRADFIPISHKGN